MGTEFGSMLRRVREDLGLSLGQVARHLKVSVSYVSDVELGKRAPLTNDRILDVSRFMCVDPAPLVEAAGKSRGFFELPSSNQTTTANQVGAALARRWTSLTEEELIRIRRIIEEEEG